MPLCPPASPEGERRATLPTGAAGKGGYDSGARPLSCQSDATPEEALISPDLRSISHLSRV